MSLQPRYFVTLFAFFATSSTPAFAQNEELLSAPDWPAYKWFASTDKKGENVDYLLLKPGETRKIPLAAGRLERLWFTAIEPEKIQLDLVSGKTISVWKNAKVGAQFLIGAKFHEKAFHFTYPYEARLHTNKPGVFNRFPWTPLTNNAHLIVRNTSNNNEGNKFFYQATIRSPKKPIWSAENAANSPYITSKTAVEIAPGKSVALVLPQRGLINELRLFAAQSQVKNLQLRAFWDGASVAAIDAPLLALVAGFDQLPRVQSAAFENLSTSIPFVMKWPMPFAAGTRLELINTSSENVALQYELQGKSAVSNLPPYRFHAVYGAARTEEKKPVRMLEVKGKGAFCGLNLAMAPAPDSGRRTFAYLEGNETITSDGTKFEGTGTEDFFTSAWYFPKEPFSFPYHGMTFKSEAPPAVNAYRLMIPDAVPFKKSLTFDLEHGKRNNSNDLIYRWVAFWYAEPTAKFEVKNSLSANGTQSAPVGAAPPLSYSQIILTALVTSFVVGGIGGLLVRRARKKK